MGKNKRNMKRVFLFFKKFKTTLISILYCLFVSIFCLLSACTSDFKMENVFNDFFRDSNCRDTYLSISNTKDNNDSFKSLYYSFFWTSLTANSRRRVDDVIKADVIESEEFGLFIQDYFTIEDNKYSSEVGRYYLHDGMFFTYFDNSLVNVNSVRFGCNGFLLISDVLADKLLEKYNLQNDGFESYKQLIVNETYAKISCSTSDNREISFCINNIIDTSQRVGTRIKDEVPFFGLTYYGYLKGLSICYEADFKGEGYSPKAVVNTIYDFGYYPETTKYTLMKKGNSGYYVDEGNSAALMHALVLKKQDSLPKIFMYLMIFVLVACVLFVNIFVNHKNNVRKDIRKIGFVIALISLALLLVQQFTKLYFLFSLVPVAYFIIWMICFSINVVFKRKEIIKNEAFFEISI